MIIKVQLLLVLKQVLDKIIAQEKSIQFEDKIGGILEKYGHSVVKLDKDRKGRKPDYLVTNIENNKVLVECKFVASGGMTEDGQHISTLNPDLVYCGVFQPTFREKYYEVLSDAQDQYKKYTKNSGNDSKLPFVVAIEADFLAEYFRFIPNDIYGLKDISAVIYLLRNVERDKELYKYSIDDLEKIIDKKLKVYTPSPSLQFKVIHNTSANIKFRPEEYLRNPIE